jgi:hypothetical protein
MDVTGKVIEILPVVTGTGAKDWKKRDFVLETEGQYQKKICITAWGATCDSVGQLHIGDMVKCFINIESREYSGKWYTDVKLWKFEIVGQTASTAAAPHSYYPPMPSATDAEILNAPEDDLPF